MLDLITGGYVAQLVILLLVWGAIFALAVMQRPIPDPLLDAGFVILGFYFNVVVNRAAHAVKNARRD